MLREEAGLNLPGVEEEGGVNPAGVWRGEDGTPLSRAAEVVKALFLPSSLYSLGANYMSRSGVQKCTRIYGLVKRTPTMNINASRHTVMSTMK